MTHKKRLTIALDLDTFKVLDKIKTEMNVSISYIIEVLVANLVATSKNNQVEKKGEN